MKDAAKGHLRSFDVVPGPVQAWLDDVVRDYAQQTVLVVGHRATFYALEHLINSVPLRDAVLAPGSGSQNGC